ncbi:MAG: Atxe2 family lasso peptide isopeptidase [Proteobacteria bacterium]|nr:Atxe2 family lasso peptide isopeptidase [Pseudomonadota bacterium]
MRVLELLAVAGAAVALPGCDSRAPVGELQVPDAVAGDRRSVTATDLIELREIGGMLGEGLSISPDGKFAAFEMHRADVAANDYRVAWFVASTEGPNVPVNVGDGGDPTLYKSVDPGGRVSGAWVSEYARWSPDSRGIAYRKRQDGETQIWWSRRDGSEVRQLSHSAADVEEFYWSEDGSSILFATDADRAEFRETEESRFRNGHVYDYDKAWSTIDGRPYYPRYLLTEGEPRIWVLDVVSGSGRPATEGERAEFERLRQGAPNPDMAPEARKAAWTGRKRGVAWVQADDPEKQGISPPLTVYASLADDDLEPVRCAAEACTGVMDVSAFPPGFLRHGLHWGAVDDEVYFVRREGAGYSEHSLYGWHVGEDRVRKILTTHEWISDCAVARGRAVCFRETATHPRTIVSIDLDDGSFETLVDPNPEFRNVMLGDVEFLEWENSLGYGSFGYLVKPPDYVPGRRYPLVLVGYRARRALRGGTGNEYPVHLLAANGFMVLVYDKPKPHEAMARYSDPLDIGRAKWGPDLFDVRMPLASFESAVNLLDREGLVDPALVAITGFSSGTNNVNYSLVHSRLFAAAIASSGNFGPNNGVLAGVSKDFRKYREVIGAGPYPGPHSFLHPHMSLALNAERVESPLLVNVSDTEHPWALAEIAALVRHGKPVEMVVHADEGHVKWHPAHRFAIYERNVDWLNFWLRGVEDPSPAKADQYARWRWPRDL